MSSRPANAWLLAVLTLLGGACTGDKAPVALRVSPQSPAVPLGITVTLDAVAELANGESEILDGEVTWISLDPEVAQVSGTGALTGLSKGRARIRVESLEWGLEAETEVTVVGPVLRPVAEYEAAGSLFFSGQFHFGSEPVKAALLRELPDGVTAYVFTAGSPPVSSIEDWAGEVAPGAPVTAVRIDGEGNGFWARDALPIPVWIGEDESAKRLAVVDSGYYHGYEPDAAIARGFGVPRIPLGHGFEGGNFLADSQGNCFTVQKGTAVNVPDAAFRDRLGCRTLTRLPFKGGIGHVDERAKFLSDSVVVTDTPDYVAAFVAKGYDVRLLPSPSSSGDMRTYVNSLLINGTLFLPVYAEAGRNQQAIEVYGALGLRVIPLDSRTLSSQGLGSIHCVTATYPAGAAFDPGALSAPARAGGGAASFWLGEDVPVTKARPAGP